MIYSRFGKTELQMPALSAGFMRSMHSWKQVSATEIPDASQKNMEAIVTRAMELGINHFETARGYGTSEKQLGRVLQQLPRDSFIVQTKVPPDKDSAVFREKCLDSFNRLGLSKVDLLAIHGINDYRSFWQACRKGGCLQVARDLQREGRVGHVGFSGHGFCDILLEALRHEEQGGFDYMNLHWYYIYQVNTPAIEEALKRDIGVFIISPTDKGGMLQKPSERMIELCKPLSPIQFNDLYCLSHPGVQTISIGAAKPSDFDEHIQALALIDQSVELVPERDKLLLDAMERATGHRRPEGLWSMFPAWDATPGYINIPFILWLNNLARGWGLVEYARCRYQKLGDQVQWVPGNNAARVEEVDLKLAAGKAGMEKGALVDVLKKAHAFLDKKNPGLEDEIRQSDESLDIRFSN